VGESSARIGVVGGGTMGAGIAFAFAMTDARVVVIEVDQGRTAEASVAIESSVRRAEGRGHVADADAVLRNLSVTDDRDELAGVALVIEAVPEDIAVKHRVLLGVEAVVGPETVIATNTSSMSIASLATVLENRERFVGMHFFNPVPASQLVELVRGPETGLAALATARAWAERIGKQTIEVADSPGFASSRLGLVIGLEAIRMIEEGVASPADIDDAMVLGYRYPMGPLRLTDLVGLDVRLAVAEYLAETLGPRFDPPALLREKVARGELGRKSGRGFFDWDGA
jgi:3-hydroxybutyryl-CoA dehydrogenase